MQKEWIHSPKVSKKLCPSCRAVPPPFRSARGLSSKLLRSKERPRDPTFQAKTGLPRASGCATWLQKHIFADFSRPKRFHGLGVGLTHLGRELSLPFSSSRLLEPILPGPKSHHVRRKTPAKSLVHRLELGALVGQLPLNVLKNHHGGWGTTIIAGGLHSGTYMLKKDASRSSSQHHGSTTNFGSSAEKMLSSAA